MGNVYRLAQKNPTIYNKAAAVFYDLISADHSLAVTSALINPGKVSVPQAVANMTGNQVNALALKVDMIFNSDVSNPIADMVGEEFESVTTLVRILSQAAGGASQFAGIVSSGQEFDVWPLRPKDVGGVFLNGALAANLGLYGGVSAGVFTWTQTGIVAGVTQHLIPAQTTSGQAPFGGLIIFGGIEKIYTPKIESISLTLQGQAGAVPPQPAAMTMKRTFGDDNDISVFRLEKPVIITQNENFGVDIMPNVSGTTNFELIALMCGQVQSKVA
jgi:hypothetical protein